jgi:long-chain acyl-CoA synthetase
MNTIPQIIEDIQKKHPGVIAQYYREKPDAPFTPRSYADFFQDSLTFGAALMGLGVKPGEAVGLLADNRREWSVADIGTQAALGFDVPRGRDITDAEIRYIYGTTHCRVMVVERQEELARVLKAREELIDLQTIIVMEEGFSREGISASGLKILSFQDAMESGRNYRAAHPLAIEERLGQGKKEDVATVIFTSGTTGRPKGVPLTQENYLIHVEDGRERMGTEIGNVWLTMLPVWHSFERAVQYIALGNGVGLAYSKPIGSIMMRDFAEINPHYTTAVPRVWENVYNTIQKKIEAAGGIKKVMFKFFVGVGAAYVTFDNLYKGLTPAWKKRNRFLDKLLSALPRLILMPVNALGVKLVLTPIKGLFGKRLKAGVSGGGGLPRKIDLFFASAGIVLMEGYGLTEAGPVVAVRKIYHLEAGTVGTAFPHIEMKLVDETGATVAPGQMGLILARGKQIMKGYYHDPEASAQVLSADGWFNTGDLGKLTHDGALAIVGRVKDTIVLLGGENVEPVPIEKRLGYSPLIETAVVVGQDQKQLGALIVPNFKNLEEYAANNGINHNGLADLLKSPFVKELYRKTIDATINHHNGFRSFERIYNFALLDKSFEVPRELSAKQELKRAEVSRLYAETIKGIFS